MNERQRVAMEHPCGRAPEIALPRYWREEKAPAKFHTLRSGLTINR